MDPNNNPNQPPVGPEGSAGNQQDGTYRPTPPGSSLNRPIYTPPTPTGGGPVVIPQGIYPNAPDSRLADAEVARTAWPAAPPGMSAPPAPAPVQSLAAKPKHGRFRDGWKSIVGTVLLLVLAPLIALSITAFAFQSYQVDGASMETTLQNNDRLIVNKLPRSLSRITGGKYIPSRGDIIIFNQTGLNGGTGQKQLIKRVIGLPGETVSVANGVVTVYNKTHTNGFNPDKAGIYSLSAKTTPGTANYTLSDDVIFVMGDNRTNSEDSRYFGPVSTDNIVGKLSLRVIPLNKIQKF